MEELTINEIHANTLEILEKIISICDEININYYLVFGSLIGAVRHKGFIPWDDDLDIAMLRPDYDIFTNYCLKHAKELYPFKLLNRTNTPNYPYNISRFNDFRFKAVYDNICPYDSGLFIDIYPFDGAGNMSAEDIRIFDKKRKVLFNEIILAIDDHYEPSRHNKWYRSLIKAIVRKYTKIKGSAYFLDKMENYKNLFTIDSSKYVAEMVWDPETVLLNKEIFDGFSTVEFEGLKVKAPTDPDAFLRAYYGDYMKLPPVEDRHPTHEYKLYRR